MKSEKYAYCLYHKVWFTKKTIKSKCTAQRYKNRKQCKHLIILKEDLTNASKNNNGSNDRRN